MSAATEQLWPTVVKAKPRPEDPQQIRLTIQLPRPLDRFEHNALIARQDEAAAPGPNLQIKKNKTKFTAVVSLAALLDEVSKIQTVLAEVQTAGHHLRTQYEDAKRQLIHDSFPSLKKQGFVPPDFEAVD